MINALSGLIALLYGTILVWAAVNITHHMTRLVILPRPTPYVALRMAAVWTVGLTSIVVGVVAIVEGLKLIGTQ